MKGKTLKVHRSSMIVLVIVVFVIGTGIGYGIFSLTFYPHHFMFDHHEKCDQMTSENFMMSPTCQNIDKHDSQHRHMMMDNMMMDNMMMDNMMNSQYMEEKMNQMMELGR